MKKYFKILFAFVLMFGFSSFVKAEEITDYQTIYYYRRSNDNVSRTYGYVPTSSQPINGITLDGTLNNSTFFNFLTGYNNKINYSFASGLDYIITTRLSFSNIEGFSYHGTDPNDYLLGYGWRYQDANTRLVNFSKVGTSNVNLISTNVSTKFTSCYEGYDDMNFCTYNVIIVQRVHINSNINQLSIGSYTTSDYSIGVWKHLYDSLVSITSVDVVADTDSTIIDQNQQIIDKQDELNNAISGEHEDYENKSCGIICKLKKLPGRIVDGLINGLKSLFVPDNFDFLTNFKDTLENKLGFIASIPIQVLDYLISLKDKVFTPITTIKFPKISIFGYYFWDEYTINTSDGLSWISSFKYFTDFGCVIICINTLRKWYSNFTGGDEK